MGFLLMSARELQKIAVLAQVLGLSQRQVQRLVRDVRVDGAVAVRHKLLGRASNNRISDLKRDYILSLIRSDYPAFGPTLAAEKLAERHGIRVSSESLRQWMMAAGLWQSRTQRRQVHQPRLQRAPQPALWPSPCPAREPASTGQSARLAAQRHPLHPRSAAGRREPHRPFRAPEVPSRRQ
ncbi:hypothetical protein PAF17_20095 [Paracoccus sp. Z330]|uniref:Helix-turn-helix domain-containing protein n=1 Tax=Paracoccus onchidii TaxID=3017813 RepID=A0ABT4ZK65_9RHOB|nr:hypothetical protein [Paracoccus onchidii]MDB6179736.1 hypothetical protein [Paracoccus onchidii]